MNVDIKDAEFEEFVTNFDPPKKRKREQNENLAESAKKICRQQIDAKFVPMNYNLEKTELLSNENVEKAELIPNENQPESFFDRYFAKFSKSLFYGTTF